MDKKSFLIIYLSGGIGFMELHKELGMIPLEAHRRGLHAEIAGYISDGLGDSFKGVRFRRFRRGPSLPFISSISRHLYLLAWLAFSASRIDCLTIVHSSKASLHAARLYRLFNNQGVLYFKTDLSTRYLESISVSERSLSIFKKLLTASTITGVETSAMLEACRMRLALPPELDGKLKLILNGFSPEREVSAKTEFLKEKFILYVGYVGTEAKRSELLLEAFEQLLPSSWRLVMIGPIAPAFQPRLDAFREKYPGVLDIPGPIYDHVELYDYYRRAAIFCLSSRWESFCYSLLEAAYFDDYVISTDVGVAADLLASGAQGCIVEPDPAAMALAINNAIASFDHNALVINNLAIREKYSWANVLAPLFMELDKS